MNSKTIVRFYQTVKPHHPSIRFRYGIPEINKPESTTSTASSGASYVLEGTQLPPKFKRAQLDEAEINAINSGGAE